MTVLKKMVPSDLISNYQARSMILKVTHVGGGWVWLARLALGASLARLVEGVPSSPNLGEEGHLPLVCTYEDYCDSSRSQD